jgi:GAF domain-containing protein
MNDVDLSLQNPARLAALNASGLLDTPSETAYDRLTKLVTTALRVPVALISLVDDHRQFFKSLCGLPEPWATQRETPLTHSFCQHVVVSADALVVEDAREHAFLKSNLAVRDIGVIAYAGVPIVDARGNILGSLCAIDGQPRQWTKEDLDLLRAISAQITAELSLRQSSLVLVEEIARQQQAAAVYHRIARFNVHDLRTPLSAMLLGLDVVSATWPAEC